MSKSVDNGIIKNFHERTVRF